MTYYVYVIQAEQTGRLYVGMSSNVVKRIREHNLGRVFSTKGYLPWKLVHMEECGTNRADARKREKYLKSGVGKEFLKENIPV